MRWGLASVLVLMLFGIVFADEVKDTERRLTPEQAREEIQYELNHLSLEDVTSLTPEVAAILATHKGETLSLPGLKSLSPDVSAALAAYKGELALDGLETLSVKAAEALARHVGPLRLSGISSLTDDAAEALARHSGNLCLESIKQLHCDPLARELLLSTTGLGRFDGSGLESLSRDVAELLVIQGQGFGGLYLHNLKSPSLDVLRVLARVDGDLGLFVEALTPEMARVLVSQPGNLALPAVKQIDKATLLTLAKKEGGLELYLTEITPDIAAVLSEFRGDLRLHAERLPDDGEQLFAKSGVRSLVMPELKEIRAAEFARRLVESQDSEGNWNLVLEDMSPAVAEEFKAFQGRLVLPKLEAVSPDVADRLSECKGDVMLPALSELTSPALAKKLATSPSGLAYELNTFGDYKGLCLPKLKALSADVARVLASQPGNVLMLDGLNALSDESAEALASFGGILSLTGITTLPSQIQRTLGQGNVSHVRLSGLLKLTDSVLATKIVGVQQLEEINAAVAAVLAGRSRSVGGVNGFFPPGRDVLSLNLREITPGVAAALVEDDHRWTREAVVVLPRLQTVDAASASALARCRGPVELPGLQKLSPEAAELLRSNKDIILPKQLQP